MRGSGTDNQYGTTRSGDMPRVVVSSWLPDLTLALAHCTGSSVPGGQKWPAGQGPASKASQTSLYSS